MHLKFAISFLLTISIDLQAQDLTRCQCTYKDWVGDCRARVELKEKWFKVVSNTQQCSRVDWYIDGNPHVTIVSDGAELEEWSGGEKSPELAIQSCKVCKDSEFLGENTARPISGECTYSFVNVRSNIQGFYSGQCKNGKANGIGRVIYDDGFFQEGRFVDGMTSGQGISVSFNGFRYLGEFRNGIAEGQGVFFQEDGDMQAGLFREGHIWNGWWFRTNGAACEIREHQPVKRDCFSWETE